MIITKTIEHTFETDVDVDVDPEDVLDEMSIDDIEEYLEDRRNEYAKDTSDEEVKWHIKCACSNHLPRNVAITNKDVKEAINSIIDMLFPS